MVVANDPLYLVSPTSVPEEPWDNTPMFEQWGDIRYYSVTVDGREETIEVKYSIVKPEALRTDLVTQNPGGHREVGTPDITSGCQLFERTEKSS